jgi:ABC-type lipoprotein release transport system permease subunit
LTASLLFGVTPAHPVVMGSVATIVLIVAMAACLEPAARAGRTSIVSALRGS